MISCTAYIVVHPYYCEFWATFFRNERAWWFTCSYKSISFLSGNLRGWIACSTVSQWPLFISPTKLSTLSTVFRVIPVSSFKRKNNTVNLYNFNVCREPKHKPLLLPVSSYKYLTLVPNKSNFIQTVKSIMY